MVPDVRVTVPLVQYSCSILCVGHLAPVQEVINACRIFIGMPEGKIQFEDSGADGRKIN
jgi:hypothetical protein